MDIKRMDIKGVCYDVGRAYSRRFVTRQVFDPALTRRELRIIRDDLHCNAVHLQASTSLVKTYARAGGTRGLPWEPKPAFDAVAEFYATR